MVSCHSLYTNSRCGTLDARTLCFKRMRCGPWESSTAYKTGAADSGRTRRRRWRGRGVSQDGSCYKVQSPNPFIQVIVLETSNCCLAFIHSSWTFTIEQQRKGGPTFKSASSLTPFSLLPTHLNRVEKYRPNSLDDLVSHRDITTTSQYPPLSLSLSSPLPSPLFSFPFPISSLPFPISALSSDSFLICLPYSYLPFHSREIHRKRTSTTHALLWTTWNWKD